jgi:hypothetical protein
MIYVVVVGSRPLDWFASLTDANDSARTLGGMVLAIWASS